MRVTDQGRQQQILADLQAKLAEFAKANRQVDTGKRFTTVSEDPVSAVNVMQISSRLQAISQYQRNANFAQVRQKTEEQVIQTVNDLLSSAKNIAVQAAGADIGTAQRQQASNQIDLILKQVISLGNTQVGSDYIFAGQKSGSPAFDTTPGGTEGNYLGGTTARQTELEKGLSVTINSTGDTLFGDPAPGVPGVISSLKNLRDALAGGAAETQGQILSTRLSDLVRSSDSLQLPLVDVGGRLAQIDQVGKFQDQLTTQLETQRDSLVSIPPEEAASNLLQLQTALQAAYAATSRVLSTSLTNYLPA
jgi:flagellar hook-associated protein 3 FlgL